MSAARSERSLWPAPWAGASMAQPLEEMVQTMVVPTISAKIRDFMAIFMEEFLSRPFELVPAGRKLLGERPADEI
jgi:hypothetical protein